MSRKQDVRKHTRNPTKDISKHASNYHGAFKHFHDFRNRFGSGELSVKRLVALVTFGFLSYSVCLIKRSAKAKNQKR
eukprot:5108393-Amphidinium_carterae.1